MGSLIFYAFILYNLINPSNNANLDSYFLDKYNINFEKVFDTYELTANDKKYVSHAGGRMGKLTYVNNYEALKNSYDKGYRLIELDIEFTSDNVPVMLHSWDGFINTYFNVEGGKTYSYNQFKKFEMINGWHQLSLEDVINYMDTEFDEMYLITDTKNDNKKLLSLIKDEYSYMQSRIIPQVYSQDEYEYAKNLGYKNIIYTLYLSEDTKEEIIDFARREKPFAITMSTSWAYTDLPLYLERLGVYTYCHTINDKSEYDFLKLNGIKGIYTDELIEK